MAERGKDSPPGSRIRAYLERQRQNREARLARQNAADAERRADNAAAARQEADRERRAEASRQREIARRTNVPAISGTREVTVPSQAAGQVPAVRAAGQVPAVQAAGQVPAVQGRQIPLSLGPGEAPAQRGAAGALRGAASAAGQAARTAITRHPAVLVPLGLLGAAAVADATLRGMSPEQIEEAAGRGPGQPTPYVGRYTPAEEQPPAAPQPVQEEIETVVTAPARPRRVVRPVSDDGEADRLNELSLRAIRGKPPTNDPRDRNIRRAMGLKNGGRVEGYASGGAVGKRGASTCHAKARGDGVAKTGRTRCRII